jgi:hypothetical protein
MIRLYYNDILMNCFIILIVQRDNWVKPGVDGRIILMRIFKKWDVRLWTGMSWLRIDSGRPLVNAVMNLQVP